jgi:hypothetical protein
MLEQVTRGTGAEGLSNLSRCVQPVKLRHAGVDDDKSYERDGDEMASSELYVELEPRGYHISSAIAPTAMNRTGRLTIVEIGEATIILSSLTRSETSARAISGLFLDGPDSKSDGTRLVASDGG